MLGDSKAPSESPSPHGSRGAGQKASLSVIITTLLHSQAAVSLPDGNLHNTILRDTEASNGNWYLCGKRSFSPGGARVHTLVCHQAKPAKPSKVWDEAAKATIQLWHYEGYIKTSWTERAKTFFILSRIITAATGRRLKLRRLTLQVLLELTGKATLFDKTTSQSALIAGPVPARMLRSCR
jgi:hypothetical protein